MNTKEIISKKINKKSLNSNEIDFIIKNFIAKKISEEEMSDFLKAVYQNGMNEKETINFTQAMTNSGEIVKYKNKKFIYTDKHSTGGISDSTTLIIAPIIACTNLKFLKMSGRKLGFTGGTADKLECFKGYKTNISIKEAERLVNKNGAVLMTQTEELAPADKYIYQLRDKTNTIMNIPLIASSIMSKKLASGNDVLVLDVKCGNGAFIKSLKNAKKLAKLMIKIGNNSGKRVSAVISDMNQPLGQYIGSLLETIEAINVLKGQKNRLSKLSLFLASKIIELGKNIPFIKAEKLAKKILFSGKALKKLKKMIKNQVGSLDLFNDKKVNEIISTPIILKSQKEGFISKFELEKLGYMVREYCTEGNFGIKVLVNLGDYVKKGSPVIELYGQKSKLDFLSCLHYSKTKKSTDKLIIDVL